jgi:Acyl-CoA synthetases (AMP-forming)/AMP-acid ligases II
MNFYQLLQEKTDLHQKKIFFHWDKYAHSYQDFCAQVDCIAAKMTQISLKGKLCGIYSPDTFFQLSHFFAIQKLGGIPLLIHNHIPPQELLNILKENQIHYLSTDSPNPTFDFPCLYQNNTHQFYQTLNCSNSFNEKINLAVPTSGSTGIPKVLFRSFSSWADFFPIQNQIFQINSDTRLYFHGALSFTGNLNLILGVLAAGGTIAGTSSLRPTKWLADLQAYSISHLYLIPTKLAVLASHQKTAISAVRQILSGSQLLGPKTLQLLYRHFPQSEIILYYGASEINYVSWLKGDEILAKPTSVGRPFPKVNIDIKDGKIYVDSPFHVENLTPPSTVGDCGYIDSDGHLIFQGRGEDFYNIKGIQVSKLKIINYLKNHPRIIDAEIIPYQLNNDTKLAAFIATETRDLPKLQSYLKTHLQPAEIPSRFIYLKQLPRTSTGKTDHKRLQSYL